MCYDPLPTLPLLNTRRCASNQRHVDTQLRAESTAQSRLRISLSQTTLLLVTSFNSYPVFIRSGRALAVSICVAFWLEKGTSIRLTLANPRNLRRNYVPVQGLILSLTSVWFYLGRHWRVDVRAWLVHVSYHRHIVTAHRNGVLPSSNTCKVHSTVCCSWLPLLRVRAYRLKDTPSLAKELLSETLSKHAHAQPNAE